MSLLSWIFSNVVLSLVLALGAWFTQRWLLRPAVARILWVLVLVKLVTPPLFSLPLGKSPSSVACVLGTCGCEQHAQTQTIVRDRLPWILLAVWSAGASAKGWTAWRHWTRFRRLMAHASPAPPEWQTLAARLASELSIRCRPEILAVPGRLPPLVVPGRHRPCVLLPTALLSQLSASQRVAMLLHELVHIKRGDHLVRVLELTVGVAYWWLPIVGSIGRQLRACEEMSCDAAVMAHLPEARREYAKLLLDVDDFANPLPGHAAPQATAMSAANGFERRLRAILDATQGIPARRDTWPVGVLAVGLACAILPCELNYGSVGQPRPAATSADHEPAAGASSLPGSDREAELAKFSCCPS